MAASPTYRALLDDAAQRLYEGSDTPRIDAEVLMQHLLARPMAWLIAYGDTIATAEHIRDFAMLVEQRYHGQPIAYLTGHREFWTLDLKVNEHVLVPRADTETLVEYALQNLQDVENPRILDLGTGSGAIALALAKERKDATVTATDISVAALEVAKQNAEYNKIDNVEFVKSRWFEQLEKQPFDLIAANPPYVAPGDPHLEQGDLRFEPDIALSACNNGLADLDTIIQGAPLFLVTGGVLIVEHGHEQGPEVGKLFADAGLKDIQLRHDISGLPRCTGGRLING